MFIVCARLLWAFDFRSPSGCSAPDANDELGTWSDGFLCVPKMFAVEWKVRSEAKEKLILEKLEEAQERRQFPHFFPDKHVSGTGDHRTRYEEPLVIGHELRVSCRTR